jgi:adenosine deaminase CECR1
MTEAKEPPPEGDLTTKDPEALLRHFLANGGYVEAYAKQRAELLNAEAVDAWDHDAITKASPSEKRAATIIRVLREFERSVVFGNNASEAIPGPETLDMGGQFLTNKARIETNSELFKISQEVPKGAILHLHFNAELNPERLLKEAQEMDNMYVWSIQPLVTKDDLAQTEMMFKVMAPTTKSNNIFSPEYEGQAGNWRGKEFDQRVWMRWNDFQTCFEEKFGDSYIQSAQEKDDNVRSRTCSEPANVDLNPAEYWIMQKMVLSKEEAYEPTQTVNGYVVMRPGPIIQRVY